MNSINMNTWIFNYGKDIYINDYTWNFINSEIDIIPISIKQIFEKLFDSKSLNYVIRFPYNNKCINKYSILVFSNNKLLAKIQSYNMIIKNNIDISWLIKNNKKYELHFNFRDLKNIFVPKTIHDGVNWDNDKIRKNIATLINTYQDQNKIKLRSKLDVLTCNDITKIIFTYLET